LREALRRLAAAFDELKKRCDGSVLEFVEEAAAPKSGISPRTSEGSPTGRRRGRTGPHRLPHERLKSALETVERRPLTLEQDQPLALSLDTISDIDIVAL
jgi:hypothetical protein